MTNERRAFRLVLLVILLFTTGRAINFVKKTRAAKASVPIVNSIPAEYFHEAGYETASIQFVENGLVQIQIVGSKFKIVFRPSSPDLGNFQEGRLAPVTFQCSAGYNEECNLSEPYSLYVGNVLVEPVQMAGENLSDWQTVRK